MAFTQFKTLGATLVQYNLTLREENLFSEILKISAPENLKTDIAFSLKETAFDISENAICENLIYPILKEVWKQYLDFFLLWSHPNISADEVLTGIPDYLFAKKTQFGRAVVGSPICVAIEAKKDNFNEGWGQCAAEMVAAQKLNIEDLEIFGIVTNGELWEFAILKQNIFHKNLKNYHIEDLDRLFSMIATILETAKKQLNS